MRQSYLIRQKITKHWLKVQEKTKKHSKKKLIGSINCILFQQNNNTIKLKKLKNRLKIY